MEAFVAIIQTLGFPVACVIACGWLIYTMIKQNREDTNEREDRLYAEIGKFGTTLERFNDTLSSIDKRLAILESKMDR